MMDASYLEKQVSTIVNRLHELFDEIGIPDHERDSREAELYTALSHALHDHLRLVTNEKHELAEEANNLVTQIKQMRIGLEGVNGEAANDHDASLKVFHPLRNCLEGLREQHRAVRKLHAERYEQIKQLAQAIESYASHLEPSFSKIRLPPTSPGATCPPSFDLSHSYFASLDDEFTRIYNEYEKRLATVKDTAAEIIQLWAELGTPQAQTDLNIVSLSKEAPEQLGLHADDISRLKERRDRLLEEKRNRERKVKDLRTQVNQLWTRLAVAESEQKQFLAANRGCSLRTINEFEDELGRLNELKRQNLGLFVEESRLRLQQLWDALYFSEEEMLEFTPAFSDVFSDALLAAHEAEIERLTALQTQRAPILALIDKHRSIVKDREDLAASSQDASRLMLRGQKGEKRDPTRLLREEKMRKRITKELPKVEQDLRKILSNWEDEYGRPFLVMGESYLDVLESERESAAPKPSARSKTPSIPAASTTTTTKVPLKPAASATASKTGTVKKAPPPRSKTPTSTMRPVSRGALSAPNTAGSTLSRSTAQKSPSRIPARVPLGNMPHGNNSPERKIVDGNKTIHAMGPPRLPPPKMKDLFASTRAATPDLHPASGENNFSASIIRHMDPEDVYDDRDNRHAYGRSQHYPEHNMHASRIGSTYSDSSSNTAFTSSTTRTGNSNPYSMAPPVSRPNSRQISSVSSSTVSSQQTAPTVVSGSENWETFSEECSEPGGYSLNHVAQQNIYTADDAYHMKMQSQHHGFSQSTSGKRPLPDTALMAQQRMMAGKKPRGLMPPTVGRLELVNGHGARILSAEGSEAAWTDEDGYC